MRWLKVSDADGRSITQTWTRTSIQNDLEQAQTLAQVAQYSSAETITKGNPLVPSDGWQDEVKAPQDDIVVDDGYGNQQAQDDLNAGGKDGEV